jgi:hypothetical protein
MVHPGYSEGAMAASGENRRSKEIGVIQEGSAQLALFWRRLFINTTLAERRSMMQFRTRQFSQKALKNPLDLQRSPRWCKSRRA